MSFRYKLRATVKRLRARSKPFTNAGPSFAFPYRDYVSGSRRLIEPGMSLHCRPRLVREGQRGASETLGRQGFPNMQSRCSRAKAKWARAKVKSGARSWTGRTQHFFVTAQTLFGETQTLAVGTQTLFEGTQTLFEGTQTLVGETQTLVGETQTLVGETQSLH